jgi:hypothetical protein
MDKDKAMNMMINSLEINGDIRFASQGIDIYIHSIDPKEGYSYITLNGIEFDNSKEAVEWAVYQFGGLENIGRWE